METELCTEVGDQVIIGINMLTDALRHALFVVRVISGQHPLVIFHKHAVISGFLKTFLRDTPQEGFRVVTELPHRSWSSRVNRRLT